MDRPCVRTILVLKKIYKNDIRSAMTLQDLHAKGGTREQIEDALRKMPVVSTSQAGNIFHAAERILQHPAMVRAIKDQHAKTNTTFLCLSNANIVFITTILKVSPHP